MRNDEALKTLREAYVPPAFDEAGLATSMAEASARAQDVGARRRGGRRAGVMVLKVGTILLAGSLVASIIPHFLASPGKKGSPPPTGIIARAYAAVATRDEGVFHAIIETRTDEKPAPGLKHPERYGPFGSSTHREELWVDKARGMMRVDRGGGGKDVILSPSQALMRDGLRTELQIDPVLPNSFRPPGMPIGRAYVLDWDPRHPGPYALGTSASGPPIDDPFEDIDWYRKALKSGRATVDGTTTLEGTEGYRLFVPFTAPGVTTTYTVLVRTSDYLPISFEATGAGYGPDGLVAITHVTKRYLTVERVSAAEVPPGTFELEIPKNVAVIEHRSMKTSGVEQQMREMAETGRFEAFGVWWLGDRVGERRLTEGKLVLQSQKERFPGEPWEMPEYFHGSGKRWDVGSQVSQAAPVLARSSVLGSYRAEGTSALAAGKSRIDVTSYPPLPPTRWHVYTMIRKGVDTVRDLTVAGRKAQLITRKLDAGTAHYLIVDCGDASVVIQMLGWDEADVIKAAEGLRRLE